MCAVNGCNSNREWASDITSAYTEVTYHLGLDWAVVACLVTKEHAFYFIYSQSTLCAYLLSAYFRASIFSVEADVGCAV